jgi:hypothetical protein
MAPLAAWYQGPNVLFQGAAPVFRAINEFEKVWGFFNREALTSEQVIEWADDIIGLHVIEDRSVSYGYSLFTKQESVILYNPHLPEAKKVLVIGHEIGHQLLNHQHISPALGFCQQSLFQYSGIEKDASIIGFLSLIPTYALLKLQSENRLDPEAVYDQYLHLWGDIPDGFAWAVCQARVRIFNALLRRISTNTLH